MGLIRQVFEALLAMPARQARFRMVGRIMGPGPHWVSVIRGRDVDLDVAQSCHVGRTNPHVPA